MWQEAGSGTGVRQSRTGDSTTSAAAMLGALHRAAEAALLRADGEVHHAGIGAGLGVRQARLLLAAARHLHLALADDLRAHGGRMSAHARRRHRCCATMQEECSSTVQQTE